MTDLLYYPQRSCSLKTVENKLFNNSPDEARWAQLHQANPGILSLDSVQNRHKPIILPGEGRQRHCRPPICTLQEHRQLATLSANIGGASTLALAELVDELKLPSISGDLNTFGGNGIGAAAKAASVMVADIAGYDKLLKEYYDLKNHRAVPNTLRRKKRELKRAFHKMNYSLNQRGQQILSRHVSKTRKIITQTGRVGYQPIPISNQFDVQRLQKLARFGRVAGPGFIAMDGYLRYNKVSQMYRQHNPHWKREAVIQSGSFIAGIAAGAAIIFLIGVSPIGLIVGIAAAGAGAIIADRIATGAISAGYDYVYKK